ncbi:hypothetical protein Tsubulata_040078, partial [Turnera subulata]
MRTCSVLAFALIGVCHGGELRKKFYKDSCPAAEDIVRSITWKHVANNVTLPAKLLRMHFHDCFVRGCDASVLLDSTSSNTAEKAAVPNLSLGGFEVIDEVKTQLEKTCPGVVSCADILALAARDSVSFQFKKSMWEVLTGRRDGSISRASEALSNIPSPFFNFTTLKQSFASKGLTVHDLVVLSGAHTIGVGHCNFFSNRLYNFTGKGDADPSLNSTYAAFLKTKCKSLADNTTIVAMDPGTPLSFDNNYFKILKQNQGLFQSDAALLTEKGSSNIVDELLDSEDFFTEFAQSMKRMGAIEVLTGTDGEIRKKCNVDQNNGAQKGQSNGHPEGKEKGRPIHNGCPQLERISRDITRSRVASDSTLPAKLLRLHYHDCFVRGCDASLLLDSTTNNTAEKDAIPNRTIGGYDVIDQIKDRVEEECPDTVSCADIVALAARDAVSFQRPLWPVFCGRKDGRVSLASEAVRDLPSGSANFSTLKQQFLSNELDVVDLVALSGAHTIGVAHCRVISRRLYNFTGKGDTDPSIDPDYAKFLKTKCPNPSTNTDIVGMDPSTPLSFDSNYYVALNQKKGLFSSDAALLTDPDAASIAKTFENPFVFFNQFARSMVKMGSMGHQDWKDGEIRKNCHF